MSIVLIFSSILLLIGILFSVYGFKNPYSLSSKEFGISCIFVAIVFGFGVFGILIPVDEDSYPVKEYSIISDEYRVVISTPDHYKVLEELKYKDLQKEDINLYLIELKNSYGLKWFDSELKIEFKE